MTGVTSEAASLRLGGAGRISDDRVRLLEAIATHGSITAAGRAVGLQYRATWDAVRTINNLFPRPLVKAQAGGRDGGSAALTPEGEAALRVLRHVEAEIAGAVGRLRQMLDRDADIGLALHPWTFVMRTSARNAFRGVITAIVDGVVSSEITLEIAEDMEITAVISRRSAESLGLVVGGAAVALIKASLVILAVGDPPPRTSARNVLKGRVVALDEGVANCEVVLEVADSKSLTATITRESGQALGLQLGGPATALIKASHVILAVE